MSPNAPTAPRWQTYVAMGDSFTEGMCDPGPAPDAFRGWADRLAERLDAGWQTAGGGFHYANLAIRGRLLPQILAEQVPVALEVAPDLVSLVGGGNDVLRPGSDVDALAASMEDAVARLRATGADVLMATGMDPKDSAVLRLTRGRVAVYNSHLWSIAQRHGAYVLDLWGTRVLRDWRMWAPDRIHLNEEGHRRVSELAATALGLDAADAAWSVPLPPPAPRVRKDALREEAAWLRGHVTPWVQRRLRGESSGDGRTPKRPVPTPFEPAPTGQPAPADQPAPTDQTR